MRWSCIAGAAIGIACQPPSPSTHPAAAPTDAAPTNAAPTNAQRTPAPSIRAMMAAVDEARITRDLHFIAKPRPPGSPHHAAVGKLCHERLGALGYDVTRDVFGSGTNIVGTRRGSSAERVILSAHYDHIPGCSGADDNASGVAALLEAARVLASLELERDLVVACWDDEERGLVGSSSYAARARKRGDQITVAVSLDGVGVAHHDPYTQRLPPGFETLFPEQTRKLDANDRRADFIAVIGDTAAQPAIEAFARRAAELELPIQPFTLGTLTRLALRDTHRSDHASFWLQGYAGVIVSDTADFRYRGYHCGAHDDTAEHIDFVFLTKVTAATVGAAADLLAATPQSEELDDYK